jgi:hypothetical protein
MKTRYKTGKFTQDIEVSDGDTLNLIITEPNGAKQRVSEDIMIPMTITHWVMFYVPGVGFGGMFGGPDLGSKMSEIFVNPERVDDKEILIA